MKKGANNYLKEKKRDSALYNIYIFYKKKF